MIRYAFGASDQGFQLLFAQECRVIRLQHSAGEQGGEHGEQDGSAFDQVSIFQKSNFLLSLMLMEGHGMATGLRLRYPCPQELVVNRATRKAGL